MLIWLRLQQTLQGGFEGRMQTCSGVPSLNELSCTGSDTGSSAMPLMVGRSCQLTHCRPSALWCVV